MQTNLQKKITKLHSFTRELGPLLVNAEADVIVDKLNQRRTLLIDLQRYSASLSAGVDNKSKKQNQELETIVKSIMDLDNKNMEVVQTKLANLSDSISELAREQKAIQRLRSVSKKDQKQLVDFLY